MMRAGGGRSVALEMLGETVRVRSRADLCWGQRRLDSSLEKSDGTGYIHGLCVCERQLGCTDCLFVTVQVSRVASKDIKMCMLVPHLSTVNILFCYFGILIIEVNQLTSLAAPELLSIGT